MQTILNYINGKLCEPVAGNYIDNVEPATGLIYSRCPRSNQADLDEAIKASANAFSTWRDAPLEQRAKVLSRIADIIENRLDELALAESKDNGKPVSLAKAVDIPRAAANFRFFAQAITQFSSESHSMPGEAINYTLRDPIGTVGCISPWNLPLYLFTWKIAPAIAAGNCVIAKPSEVTPMTAFLLSEICIEAGLPPGVLNIIHGMGAEIGDALCRSLEIKAISFTGGTSTGKHIAEVAAPMFKKLSLELGGKNPAVVFADCNIDKTVDGVLRSAFANQGQICLCGSRIYVERAIYDEFKTRLVEKAKALVVGDPEVSSTGVGALVSKAHMEKVLSYIELAKSEGGRLLCGGEQVHLEGRCDNGFFVAPTLFEGLSNHCRTNQEEIFGPVATLQPFDSDEQAIELANDSQYGLAASIWTNNLARSQRLSREIKTGIVWVNCWLLRDLRTPFGGMKSSGVGREGGLEVLRFFTEPKNVCIATT